MGALFLAGPLGLVATTCYDVASLSRGTGVGSEIGTLVCDWKVEHGVAPPSPLTSLAGPALNLLKQGGALLRDGHRDVFLRRIGRGAPVNRLDPPGHVKAACSRSP